MDWTLTIILISLLWNPNLREFEIYFDLWMCVLKRPYDHIASKLKDKSNFTYYNIKKFGHYSTECKLPRNNKPNKDKEKTNPVKEEMNETTLIMAIKETYGEGLLQGITQFELQLSVHMNPWMVIIPKCQLGWFMSWVCTLSFDLRHQRYLVDGWSCFDYDLWFPSHRIPKTSYIGYNMKSTMMIVWSICDHPPQ